MENIALGHPKAELYAVIGIAHPKWGERPLLLVKLKPGEAAEADDFLAYFAGKIAKWWMPDEVRFVDEIPLGATGKIDKKLLLLADSQELRGADLGPQRMSEVTSAIVGHMLGRPAQDDETLTRTMTLNGQLMAPTC